MSLYPQAPTNKNTSSLDGVFNLDTWFSSSSINRFIIITIGVTLRIAITQGAIGMEWIKKHKVASVILVIIILAAIAGASGEGTKSNTSDNNSNTTSTNESSNQKTYKFDDRADKQEKDVEVLPNETATVGGVKMTLTNVEYKVNLSDFETADSGKTYVLADVALENTSGETQPYNVFDFRIQTSGGQVLDGAFSTITTLGSGDLVSGGKAAGKIVFEVPQEDGHQYVIWKPNAFNADRAIIQIK